MLGHTYYVDKETGTPADTLLAFGVADFLDHLIPEEEGDVGLRVDDLDDCYGIALKRPIEPEWVSRARFFAMSPALSTKTQKATVSGTVDYLAHQERNNVYFEARKRGFEDEELREQGIDPPHPNWPTWAIINLLLRGQVPMRVQPQ